METIKSSTEISRLFEQGSRLNTPYIMILVGASKEEHDREGRVAFIAGKKNGNAVWRNSAKRRLRAVYSESGLSSFPGDLGMVAKKNLLDAAYRDVLEETEKAAERLFRKKQG